MLLRRLLALALGLAAGVALSELALRVLDLPRFHRPHTAPSQFDFLQSRTDGRVFFVNKRNDPIPFVDKESPPHDEAVRKRYYLEQLFDLTEDPGEQQNVIGKHPDLAAAFHNDVFQYQSRGPTSSQAKPLAADTCEHLKPLRYLGE